MNKVKVAIVGYGNIGKFAVDAVEQSIDIELLGIVRRENSISQKIKHFDYPIVSDINDLGKVDVAILCTPTRTIPQVASKIASLGINTVDSFDIHGEALWELKQQLTGINEKSNAVSIISAGWDPGSDSVVRTLMEAIVPIGITYTNFGPGMSMGHSVVAKSIKGVKDALSITIPVGTAIHRRMVYLELEDGADFANIKQILLKDKYFVNDQTIVTQVESVAQLLDMGHGVSMERKGVSGKTHNQLLEFKMKINNPALTAQVLVASARASMKQSKGCYTLPEIPVMDMLYGDRESLIKKLI